MAVQLGTAQDADTLLDKAGAATTQMLNSIVKHEPETDAMEVDAPQASANGGAERPNLPKWRWRLLSFTLLPGAHCHAPPAASRPWVVLRCDTARRL